MAATLRPLAIEAALLIFTSHFVSQLYCGAQEFIIPKLLKQINRTYAFSDHLKKQSALKPRWSRKMLMTPHTIQVTLASSEIQ